MSHVRFTAALMAGIVGIADAAGPVPSSGNESDHEFALRLSESELDLHYPGAAIDTRVQWIGVTWRERYGERLQLGLYGGYSFLTQGNNPLTAGQELDGYHAGISLHTVLLQTRRASLYLAADYTYQNVKNTEAGQTVRIDLQQPLGQLGLAVRMGTNLRAYGGGYYGAIDGQQRASGSMNETLDLKHDARGGAFFGLDLDVGDRGHVGAELRSGPLRAVEIYFKRLF